MSRGIGDLQRAVLKALETNGGPMLSVDLVIGVFRAVHGDGESTIPFSFYESTRRAAASLVKRRALLAGTPRRKMRDRHHPAKVIFWLPGQTPPELDKRRTIPQAVVEYGILRFLADGPQEYGHVMNHVGKRIARDQRQYEMLRVTVSRAVKRLVAKGDVRRDGNLLSVGMQYKTISSQQLSNQ